jgi:putative nucleotidyltransferase with HDIG domain
MDEFTTTRAMRFLPHALVTTFVIAVVPVVVGWWLRAQDVISSAWACIGVAIVMSLALSAAGNSWWRRRAQSADVLFSELLIWGWLRRYRVERQLRGATAMLGLRSGSPRVADAESVERRQQLLKQLSDALDAQDPFLDGHSRRVARYAATVARCMGLSDAEVSTIRTAAAVHDVGKLRVPRELLQKPTPLTDAEFDVVMRHAVVGAEMVACLGNPELTEIVRHHHERVDGLGYPSGLSGDDIPLGARIVAVADTFDAITSARPYRPAARHKQALDVLAGNAGTQLDPAVVRTFLHYYSGRKASVLWIILAVSPQRAVAWMRGGRSGGPAPVVPKGELAVSAIGRVAFVAATVGTTVAVGAAHSENPLLHRGTHLQLTAAAPLQLYAGAHPRSRGAAARPSHVTAGAARVVSASISRAAVRAPARDQPSAHVTAGRRSATSTPSPPVPGGGAHPGATATPPTPGATSPQASPAPPVAVNATPAPPIPAPPVVVKGPGTQPPPDGGGGRHHPKHGGPGDGGWGPGGRQPHDGPGEGGWGPGGNPHDDAPPGPPPPVVPQPPSDGASAGRGHSSHGH